MVEPLPAAWTPAATALVDLLSGTARGPRRTGLFALWLVVRVVEDLRLDPPTPERARRRRLAAVEARFATLALPAPLRRALGASVAQLREGPGDRGVLALGQLMAPVRDTLGSDAADALAAAVRRARD